MNKRSYGQYLEQIALRDYLAEGYILLAQNYTMRGGEIDLIVENKYHRVYIEVKGVDKMDSIHDYVTRRKISHISKTIAYHLIAYPTEKLYQLDVVFIQNNRILAKYENVSLFL